MSKKQSNEAQMNSENFDEDKSLKEGEFDMGDVSVENEVSAVDPALAAIPEKKPRKARGEAKPKEPKEPKNPLVGEYGKRGLQETPITLLFSAEGFNNHSSAAKHHQRVVIFELLSSGVNNVKDITLAIENTPELLQRMNTKQPVLRCVLYQLNELKKAGAVSYVSAARGKKEDGEATEAAPTVEAVEATEATAETASA